MVYYFFRCNTMLAKKEYKFHYVYEILELSTNKKYIGKRSCNREPNKDLGHWYFSSSTNKDFIKRQKENQSDYQYKILSVHSSDIEALDEETRLHKLYDVANNDEFYNIAMQTSNGFQSNGYVSVIDKDGNTV